MVKLMKKLSKSEEFYLPFVRFCFIMISICYKGELWLGELIAFVSGKGGTGKTTLCAGIATALALDGKKVLCVDCDVGLRNLDIALAMSDSGAISFLEALREEYGLESAAVHPLYSTLSFLTAPLCPMDQIPVEQVGQLLNEARSRFDYILLDAPAGIETGFRMAARYCDRILLITGSDPASIRDAARAAQELRRMGKNNLRLIVNRVDKRALKDMGLTVDDIMDQTGLPLLGIVPEDSDVLFAAAFQEPLLEFTNRGAALACSRIAGRIKGRNVRISL